MIGCTSSFPEFPFELEGEEVIVRPFCPGEKIPHGSVQSNDRNASVNSSRWTCPVEETTQNRRGEDDWERRESIIEGGNVNSESLIQKVKPV